MNIFLFLPHEGSTLNIPNKKLQVPYLSQFVQLDVGLQLPKPDFWLERTEEQTALMLEHHVLISGLQTPHHGLRWAAQYSHTSLSPLMGCDKREMSFCSCTESVNDLFIFLFFIFRNFFLALSVQAPRPNALRRSLIFVLFCLPHQWCSAGTSAQGLVKRWAAQL